LGSLIAKELAQMYVANNEKQENILDMDYLACIAYLPVVKMGSEQFTPAWHSAIIRLRVLKIDKNTGKNSITWGIIHVAH
jgi:hypothetical protein